MIAMLFTQQMMTAFPGGAQDSRKQFAAMLSDFTGKVKLETLDHVLHEATMNWDGKGKPTMPWLFDKAAQVERGVRQLQDDTKYGYRCRGVLHRREDGRADRECMTLLARNATCPVCGNSGSFDIVALSTGHGHLVSAQEDCHRCKVYDDESRRYGPTCDRWGYHDAGEMCRDCRCAPCCSMQRRIATSPKNAVWDLKQEQFPWLVWKDKSESRSVVQILRDMKAAAASRWDQ